MRILYLNNDKIVGTGSGNFLNNLTNALKKIRYDLKYDVLTKEDIFSGFIFLFFFRFFKIRNIFKKFDIIHALDGWPYGFIAVFCSIGLKKKVIITAIGTGAVQPLYKPIKKQLLIWAYKKASSVIAISSHTKKEIQKIIPNLKINVINHGVDFYKFQNVSNKDTEEINKLKPYILSVGALKKRKGLDYSIKVFAKIAGVFKTLKYVIVGQGPELTDLLKLVISCNLSERVIFFKKIEFDFLLDLYHKAELFVLLPQDDNKDIEGFGLVFLEAAACGLPVVGSKNTSADDAVLDGENGFLVSSKNINEISQKMTQILSMSDLRSKFSKKSLEFAKHMSWEKVAKSYIARYVK